MKTNTRKQTMNLYFDRNDQAFFYVSKTRSAYFIPEKDLTMAYIVVYRYLIGLSIAAVLGTLFSKSLIYAVSAGLLLTLYLEYHYRKKMLFNYRLQRPYTPHNKKVQTSKNKTLLKIVLYYLMAILVFVSIYFEKNEGASLIILIAMAGISIIAGTQELLSYLKK